MAIGYRRSADICQNRDLRDCGGGGWRLWVSRYLKLDISVFLIKVYPNALDLLNHNRVVNLMKNG